MNGGGLPLRWTAAVRDRLRAAAERREGGYVLEGRKLVADALALPSLAVVEIWLADDLPPDVARALDAAAVARNVRVGRAPARELERTSDVVTPQGVLAWVRDPAMPVDALLGAPGIVVLLDGVQDPGNVGAVLRCAAAFGLRGALVGTGSADPVGPKALRAAAGTTLALPFARGTPDDLVAAARRAPAEIWLLDGEGDDLWSLDARPARLVLAVGSEGRGAGPTVAGAATRRLAIPIARRVESLNAAVAFGIAVAHLTRLPLAAAKPASPAPRPAPKPAAKPAAPAAKPAATPAPRPAPRGPRR